MWIIIIVSLIGFWSALVALVARLCDWQVLPAALITGMVAIALLAFDYFMCRAAGFRLPEDQGINLEAYFGKTH